MCCSHQHQDNNTYSSVNHVIVILSQNVPEVSWIQHIDGLIDFIRFAGRIINKHKTDIRSATKIK